MKRRIREIIAYLIDPEWSEFKDPAVLHDELEDMGFSRDEITQALNMLDIESIHEDSISSSGLSVLTRIMGEAEKLILSVPAQGYLLKLSRMGWLSEAQFSLIIENAGLEFSPPVSIDEIKEIASRYVSDLPEDIPSDIARRGGQVH